MGRSPVSRLRMLSFIAFWLASFLISESATADLRSGAVRMRLVRDGVALAGVEVRLVHNQTGERQALLTDAEGVVVFRHLDPGRYEVLADGAQWLLPPVSSELLCLDVDVAHLLFPSTGRFGRSSLAADQLASWPHGVTVGAVLETLEPVAVTDRVDVAGIESSTQALWGARGSSWTQNRVLLDGMDITEPAGGRALLYPDVAFLEEIALESAVHGAGAAGPGAELQLVSRSMPPSLRGSALFHYTGSALQSENLDAELTALRVEPREIKSFPGGRFEIGNSRFYTALNGHDLSSRLPRFDGDERSSLLAATGKLATERWSVLGIAQRFRRPTFGARPDVSPKATVDATETFQVAQGALRGESGAMMLSFARANLSSRFSETGSPLHDLATGEVEDAPLVVRDRDRTRIGAAAHGERLLGRHLLRAGVEWSHAQEDARESVPSGMQRLTVDGQAHAVSLFSGGSERVVSLNRLAIDVQDDFLFQFLGRPWRVAPGARVDWSRSGSIRWASFSGNVSARVALRPSSELQISFSRHPHLLTSRLSAAAEGGLSWEWRRWTDADGDRNVSPEEVGGYLRRGGSAFTTIASDLPRPFTDELTIGVEKRFGDGFLRFTGYHRREKRLLQTVNVGIADESYERLVFEDVGVDGVLGTPDDVQLTIFDQKEQLGEDLFLLTHPTGLDSFAQGVDLLLHFEHGAFSWTLSGRAYRDVGISRTGNEVTQNDTGILGGLFTDPNALTHAEGRLYFDRAFTGKLALTAKLPQRFHLGAAVRYWDGQPFARWLFFPELGQGFTVVQAFPRGRLRYAFNMTVDLRLEREIALGRGSLGLAVEVFNLLNQTLQTEENARSGEDFRQPTAVQPARTIRLEGRFRF